MTTQNDRPRLVRSATQSRTSGILALMSALALGGCNATTANPFVDPGKYTLYNCADLRLAARDEARRERELQALMRKSARSPSGEFVNVFAYRSDYLRAQGYNKLAQLRLHEKRCGQR